MCTTSFCEASWDLDVRNCGEAEDGVDKVWVKLNTRMQGVTGIQKKATVSDSRGLTNQDPVVCIIL